MAVIISQVKTPVSAGHEEIVSAALKKAGLVPASVLRSGVRKTSLDARDNSRICLVSSVWAELDGEADEKRLCERKAFCDYIPQQTKNILPEKIRRDNNGEKKKVIIAGFGPAGIFAALTLAEYGFEPIVAERGGDVDEREASVRNFRSGGELDVSSNIQFGEGGAGTFSDGKLTTRINDPLCRYVLKKFAEHGAPEEILCKAKPHIGTDKLRGVIKSMREKIISLGGQVRFHTVLTDISAENGHIGSVTLNGGEKLPCGALILAVGHSARDTFEKLLSKNIFIEPKPFSVGARIEHTREAVNRSLYGKHWDNPNLPAGEYQLSYRSGGRAVYTFCMCPGGTVVPAASERETVVTNGMSEYARDGANSNSALVVSVSPDDFGNAPLDGVKFVRSIEKKAYSLTLSEGKYFAPASTVGSFLAGKGSLRGASVTPTYAPGVSECGFDEIFPQYVTDMMRTGLEKFSHKMKCFGESGAVLTAPETRTSSPVRITRGESMESVSLKGLYPCGEGAGYAGGIMSAAVDGVRCALKIIEN
ncbi:MAG: FAD-binding protein [Prevotella sp.]|nr:FAD-binding protein [Prevotella sp.]